MTGSGWLFSLALRGGGLAWDTAVPAVPVLRPGNDRGGVRRP